MIEWSEMHVAIRDSFRRFVEAEVAPKLEAIEHGGEPPYEVLRKMVSTFGLKDPQGERGILPSPLAGEGSR